MQTLSVPDTEYLSHPAAAACMHASLDTEAAPSLWCADSAATLDCMSFDVPLMT